MFTPVPLSSAVVGEPVGALAATAGGDSPV